MHRIKFLRSLKLILFVLFMLIGSLPCALMGKSILSGYEERAIRVRTQDATTQLNILSNHLITYNYLNDMSSEAINAELTLLSNLYNGRVMIIDENLKIVKDTYGISEGKTMVSEEVVKCLYGSSSNHYDKVNGFIEITVPIAESIPEADEDSEKENNIRGVLLTSVSTDTTMSTLDILSNRFVIIYTVIFIVLTALSAALSIILVKPFDRISGEISGIQYGMSYDPLRSKVYLETENIVSSFNRVLEKMKAMDESRQEFVANVSHELKTPLTSVKVLADSLNSQPDAPAELYREFMSDITEEIEREDKIINDLLAMVRLEKGAVKLNVAKADINALVEIILKRLRPIARKKDVSLTLLSNREVTAEVDEVKLSLVLTNLIENAIKYNREQGQVTVTIDADHQYFTIEVADTGIGIPEKDIELIYERFYRVDKSHSRQIGGTGLGLSIAKGAVALHKGVISAVSTEGEGSVFTVKIPLQYKAEQENK